MEGGPSLFAYCQDNPLSCVDPLGLRVSIANMTLSFGIAAPLNGGPTAACLNKCWLIVLANLFNPLPFYYLPFSGPGGEMGGFDPGSKTLGSGFLEDSAAIGSRRRRSSPAQAGRQSNRDVDPLRAGRRSGSVGFRASSIALTARAASPELCVQQAKHSSSSSCPGSGMTARPRASSARASTRGLGIALIGAGHWRPSFWA